MIIVRIRKIADYFSEAFWPVPALMVLLGVLVAWGLVAFDARFALPETLIGVRWLYRGDAESARTLLATLAGSTLGLAGILFSITIAALTLAADKMGPHLLRNFTQDRGNQCALGVFLATFAYALVVLQSVQAHSGGGDDARVAVLPLSLTAAVALALLCVATLIFFIGHMAGRINVETVITLVGRDVRSAIERLATKEPQPARPEPGFWSGAVAIHDPRRGYLEHLDADGLADWAARHGTALRLLVRPGDYVFPGCAIALVKPAVDGAAQAIREATALAADRHSSEDLEYAVRELVEVAVCALSPAINNPLTAIGVLDRLGASLCEIADLHLRSGVTLRDGRIAVVIPAFDYEGLVDVMFNMIRQYGADSAGVAIRMLEVLTSVVARETDRSRIDVLRRHADLVLGDAERRIGTPGDLDDVRCRHAELARVQREGVAAYFGAVDR